MADRSVSVRLQLRAEQYQAAAARAGVATKSLGASVDQLGKRGSQSINDMTKGMVDLSGKAAAGLAAWGVGVAALVKGLEHGITKYLDLTSAVDAYQDVTGASAEDSSRMVAIADAFGVSTDTLAGSMFRLAKNVETNADGFRKYGIEVARSGDGTIDLTQTLGNVAAAYQRVGGGQEGARIAQEAFGRGGMALIDILERERSEIDAVVAAAEKHGRIVSDDDIAAAREYQVAMGQLGDSVDALAISAGQAAVPALSDLAIVLTDVIDKVNSMRDSGWFDFVTDVIPGVSTIKQGAEAVGLLAGDHEEAAEAAAKQKQAEQDLADEIAAAEQKIADYRSGLSTLRSDSADVRNATDDLGKGFAEFVDRVQAAKISGDRWATSLDAATSSGLENRRMLDGLVGQGFAVADAMAAQGKSADVIAVAMAGYRDQIVATLTQLGFSEQQVRTYTDVLLRIPSSVGTIVTADTSQAEGSLARVLSLLGMIQRAEGMTNLNVLSGRTVGANVGPVPSGPGTMLGNAIAGLGPQAYTARVPRGGGGAGGGGGGQSPAEAAEAWRRAEADNAQRFYEHSLTSYEDYIAKLQQLRGQETQYTEQWFRLLDMENDAREERADNVARWNEAVAENEAEAVELWMTTAERQVRVGELSTAAYRRMLTARLADLEKFSDDWMEVWEQIARIDEQASREAERAAEQRERAMDQQARKREQAFDRLSRLVEQERALRDRIEDTTRAHHEKLRALEEKLSADQAAAIAQRRDALAGWADVSERVQVRWGNSAAALTRNIRDQILTFRRWSEALVAARARGVSEQVIAMLGLDKGPEALGQLQAFSSATQAEIDELNAAVAARTAQAAEQVAQEQASSYSEIGRTLRSLAERYAAEVEAQNEDFLAKQRDLTEELGALGFDHGKSYGDLIAAGLRSTIPGIRSAAQEVLDAMKPTSDALVYPGSQNPLTKPIIGPKQPAAASNVKVDVFVGNKLIQDEVKVVLRDGAGQRTIVGSK